MKEIKDDVLQSRKTKSLTRRRCGEVATEVDLLFVSGAVVTFYSEYMKMNIWKTVRR